MINLKSETWDEIKKHGYSRSDIVFISDGESWCRWEEAYFDIDYDPGYGCVMINESLVILMSDGRWFERRSYDGSEWWQLCGAPRRPDERGVIRVREKYDE